jgi:hypothetical protein
MITGKLLYAIEAREKIQMPELAPIFAIGRVAKIDFGLPRDCVLDCGVSDLFQFFGCYLA